VTGELEPEVVKMVATDEIPVPSTSNATQALVMRHLLHELVEIQRRYYAVLYYLMTDDATLLLEEFAP
jgi:hypothetical protein